MNFLLEFGKSVYNLFLEMAPYLLLGFAVAGVLSVAVRKSFVARHIGHNGYSAVLKAALLGMPLPLCSCGVVPTAGYLKNAGASRSSLISFLISTPQTGVDSIAATYGMLGPFFAIFRPVVALVTGVIGGGISSVADRFEDSASKDPKATASGSESHEERPESLAEGVKSAARYAFIESIDDIAPQFVFGLILAGLIYLLIPDGFFEDTIFASGLPGMLLMVVIGMPMYICSTSSIPIAVALIAKGISPGAAYVFLVAGPATNAATLAILHRMLGLKHTVIYLGTIIVGSLAFGPLVNLVLSGGNLSLAMAPQAQQHLHGFTWLNYGTGIILALMILGALYRRYSAAFAGREIANQIASDASTGGFYREHGPGHIGSDGKHQHWTVLRVQGMTCNHCKSNVEAALKTVNGVEQIEIDIRRGIARVWGKTQVGELRHAVEGAGYAVKE